MVNNYDNLKKVMEFKDKDDFYFVQLIQRRKDNPSLPYHSKRIRSYCMSSFEDFNKLMPSIIRRCEENKARAYVRLNRQNSVDTALRTINEISSLIRQGNASKARFAWESVAGVGGSKDFYLIDVDKEHLDFNAKIVYEVEEALILHFADTNRNPRVVCFKNYTQSGVHLLTVPFNVGIIDKINGQFQREGMPKMDIQKDANTLLYAP